MNTGWSVTDAASVEAGAWRFAHARAVKFTCACGSPWIVFGCVAGPRRTFGFSAAGSHVDIPKGGRGPAAGCHVDIPSGRGSAARSADRAREDHRVDERNPEARPVSAAPELERAGPPENGGAAHQPHRAACVGPGDDPDGRVFEDDFFLSDEVPAAGP